MAYDANQALSLMKTRLDRVQSDSSRDDLFLMQLDAAEQELASAGITIQTNDTRDLMLLIDTAVLRYRQRDSQHGDPDWYRLRRRERWLAGNDSR